MYQQSKWTVLAFILIFSSCALPVFSQQTYELGSDPIMKVSGTSTLHDWDMVSNEASGTATLRLSAGRVTTIQSAEMTLPVKTLKSGKGQMDNNAYKALNADDHPEITFTLLEAHQDGGNDWKATGRLEIAGKAETVPFLLEIASSGTNLMLSGSAAIKLTDFDVDPPTAVFGTIKTGNEMTIAIEMKLIPIK
ncbi:YceI family protein [Cyclobacterium roseum]|uniref:YceI family protein n=1 Tax=Cyclobacterium roseum TaxID=2666137 RepID=UPI0013911F20|nr:YceI family protein [Cyclobacterium roseum]